MLSQNEKQPCVTYVNMQAHDRKIFRPLHSSTHTFIYYLKREELALSFRVAPVADTGLVGDSGSDSPPRDTHRVDACNNSSALKKYMSTN